MPLMLRIKRAVCLLLALCLLPYGSAFSATSVSPEPHSPSQQVPDLASFILPETLGRVSEKFQGDPESPVIFLIQDAHAVPEAQARIRELLEHLQSVYGTPVAGLEGVVTQLDPLILRSFPDRQVLEEALAEIHERGELAGPSAAAVLSPQASDYEGLEERELYEEGLAFFLEAQRVRALSESALREVRMALEEKKRAAYSPVLLSLDAASRDFYQGRRPLIDLLRMLERVQPPPAGSQIELVLRQEARDKEESARNTSQLRDFARSLQRHYETLPQDHAVREKERALNEYLQLFQTSQTSAQDFALFLYEASRGLPVEQNFPDSYRGGLWASKRLRQLEGTDFFREFAAYAASVKDSLLRNADERALDEASQRLDRAEKWVRLELTFEEWREVENRRAEFEQGLPPDSLQAAEAFYRNAEARDGVMMSRLGAIFQRRRDLSASVVAGGFHTAGLTEALRRQKISFAVVTPEMTSIPEDSPYERQMSGDVSWRSYFRYEKGEVPLYDAFIRGLRDRLMALTDERSGAEASRYVLKRWRDQILRELALRGEIEDASRYTRFLDETAERYRSGRTPGVERVERFIEELKALEKNGALNEQNIARLLMPASRPAEAVQAALEPGARWGGPLLKIERAPEGLTVRVDSEAVSRRVRDFLNESRSELRASSPEDLITQLSQQADLQQLLLKGQSPPLSLSAAEKETLAWAFRAGYVSKSAVFLTLKGMLVTLGFKGMPWDDLAIARAFPALGDYREDALAYLFSRANAGSDSALLALAVIFRDNSASLPEKPLLELRQLIHSRIVTGKKEVYLALSFIQDHIELSDIELKKDLDLIAQGASIYGFGIRAALYVPRADDAELFTWLESVQVTLDALTQNKTAQAQSQTSALYNLRGLGKIATMVDEPTRDKIFNPLFSAAVQTQSGVLELGALEALAEAYPALSTSQKGRVAVLLQKKNAAGGESSEFALLAVQRIRAGIEESKVKADGKTESDLAGLSSLVKSPDLSGALEAILEKHKRDKAAQFVKAMEEKYNAQIFKLAEEGNPKAVEALGYLYAMVPTMEKAKIADLLSTLLEKDGAAGNAAVKAFGTFFAILGEHDRESVFAELKSKAENFNEGAILGLVKIARYYKDNNRQDRFQSIFDLVIGLSQSAYPGSLAAYGKLAAMSGKQSVVEKAYNFLSDAEEPEALLGLAGLYQTIFDLGIKKEISTKIFHEVVAGKPYAMEALGDLGEAASFLNKIKMLMTIRRHFFLRLFPASIPTAFLPWLRFSGL